MSIYNDHKVCNQCGYENPTESNFCIKCGEDIELLIIKKDTYTREIEAFVGKNSEFYIKKKKIMQEKSRVYSWNWAAFFISPVWFLYRKMYLYGLGMLAVNIIFSKLSVSSNVGGILIVGILIDIATGIYGNTLYLRHVDKQLEQSKDLDAESKSSFIRKKGGVSILAPIAVFVVVYILEFIALSAIL